MASPTPPTEQKSLQDLLGEVTWEDITADGIITIEEIERELKAKGYDPAEYDHLYE